MLQLDDAAAIKERPVMTNSDNGQAPEQPPTPGPEIRPMEPNERIIRANGVDLAVQTFGDRADPPHPPHHGRGILDGLVGGRVLRASHGRLPVRHPLRPPRHRPIGQLRAGCCALLPTRPSTGRCRPARRLGLGERPSGGYVDGGWIGQLVALENPDRVASLTLISTSPTAGPSDPDLPEMSQELQAFFAEEASEPDWSDREAVIDSIVEGERQFAGSRPFDEAAIREIAARAFDRTTNLASSITNHASIDSGDRWRERLGEASVPTLVIHGTEDPMYPYGNAVALAKEIPGAQLLALERVGHEVPPRALWDVVVPAILRLTASAP